VVSRADPAQEAPPLEGAGLLQDRVLTRLPTPHDAEQALQTPKSPQLPLTATTHDPVLQSLDSMASPTQSIPPFDGTGLLQNRDRNCVPPPHWAVHGLQAPYTLHPPLTVCGTQMNGIILWMNSELINSSKFCATRALPGPPAIWSNSRRSIPRPIPITITWMPDLAISIATFPGSSALAYLVCEPSVKTINSFLMLGRPPFSGLNIWLWANRRARSILVV